MNDNLFDDIKPWYTRGSIKFLSEVCKADYTVLEYGGGVSSLWWCEHAMEVVTMEANPEWASRLLQEMSKRPSLLKKWRLVFSPCNWNPTYAQKVDRCRKAHSSVGSEWLRQYEEQTKEEIQASEDFYLDPPDKKYDVIIIDGQIRNQTVDVLRNLITTQDIKILVFDNTEGPVMAQLAKDAVKDLMYEEFVFPEEDESLIPSWQNGWSTTVYVRN